MRALAYDLWQEALVCEQGVSKLVAAHVLQTGCLRDVKTGGAVRLTTHQDVEDQKPPAWVLAKPSIVETHQMSSVVIQVYLA
jgi:hypothetical protein